MTLQLKWLQTTRDYILSMKFRNIIYRIYADAGTFHWEFIIWAHYHVCVSAVVESTDAFMHIYMCVLVSAMVKYRTLYALNVSMCISIVPLNIWLSIWTYTFNQLTFEHGVVFLYSNHRLSMCLYIKRCDYNKKLLSCCHKTDVFFPHRSFFFMNATLQRLVSHKMAKHIV